MLILALATCCVLSVCTLQLTSLHTWPAPLWAATSPWVWQPAPAARGRTPARRHARGRSGQARAGSAAAAAQLAHPTDRPPQPPPTAPPPRARAAGWWLPSPRQAHRSRRYPPSRRPVVGRTREAQAVGPPSRTTWAGKRHAPPRAILPATRQPEARQRPRRCAGGTLRRWGSSAEQPTEIPKWAAVRRTQTRCAGGRQLPGSAQRPSLASKLARH